VTADLCTALAIQPKGGALQADEQAVVLDPEAGVTWPEFDPEAEAAPPSKHTEGAGQSR